MTQPNQLVPEGSLSATGLAELAAKTQEDWELELTETAVSPFEPLQGLFNIVTQVFLEVAETIIGVFSEFADLNKIAAVLNDVLGFFYNLVDRSGFINLFGAVMEFLGWLWELFSDQIESLLKPLFEFLYFFIDTFGDAIESFVKPILEVIKYVWDVFSDLFGGLASDILKLIFDGVAWGWETFGEPVLRAIGALVNFIADAIDPAVLQGILEDLTNFFGALINPQEFADLLKNVLGGFLEALTNAEGVVERVTDWVLNIPFVGPLVAKITGADSSGNTALDLSNLGAWAQRLLTQNSRIPAENLWGRLPDAIFGSIPVSSINFTAGNLLSQGNFNVAETVDAAGGWAWDGTTTSTGSGGSVKATATGSLQQLYSTQTIRVAAGDRLDISAVVKTSGFTAGSGRSMVLSVVPWIGTTAQTPHVVHTRTTSASTFTAMTGSRIRIGGTAESGEIALSGSITSLTVRLAVTANSGAEIWFDDVQVKKAGALAQTLVEYLTTTWEQAWNTVFGSGGVGKIWSDFITAVSQIFNRANLGVGRADAAQGNALGLIDGIAKAILGDNNPIITLPGQARDAIRALIGALFGLPASVASTAIGTANSPDLTGDVIPPLSGSIIADGEISVDVMPPAVIPPGSGAGALLTRKTDVAFSFPGNALTVNRAAFPANFYRSLDRVGTAEGITALRSNNQFTGVIRVTQAGWYLAEIGFRVDPNLLTAGFNVAPALFVGKGTSASTIFKVGSDAIQTATRTDRYSQSSFIVFLDITNIDCVAAGYDAEWTSISPQIRADETGVETYFSLSLLNKAT